MSEEKLLTVEEFAEAVQISPWTVRHWICDGKITYVKIGKLVRFRRSDLERFILKNLKKPKKGET